MPQITSNSPWFLFLLSLLLAFGISFWLYFQNKRNSGAPKAALQVLFALRFIYLTTIIGFLLNFYLRRIQNQTENPVILLAIDNSTSMVSAKDSAFIRTKFLEQFQNFSGNIRKKYEVKTILFGGESTQSSTLPAFTEKETDFDNLFNAIENNYSGLNIGALVIASDGIYNKGTSPVYKAEKLGYPVYSLACGDTSENKDALIQKINHNQVAYLGNQFPVEVLLNAKKLLNNSLTVGLYQQGVLKAEQKITVSNDDFSGAVTFTLNANATGLVKYTVKVNAAEGEKNLLNNSQSFVLEVIDNRDKILLLANAPHPDIAAIREALAGFDNYDVDCGFYEGFNKPLNAYSLVILHGFGVGQLNLLNECKNKLIPYWILNPQTTENLPGVKISASLNKSNDAEPYFVNAFGLFEINDGLKKFAKDLPAVKTFFGNYVSTNASNALINQRLGSVETDNPLLLFTEQNGLKSAAFLGDGLWRWKMRDYAEHANYNLFIELISKTVQYLSVKSDKSFFRVNAPKIAYENENIEFGAEVYNKSYEAITEPDVDLTLTNADKKSFNYTFSKTTHAYKLDLGQLAPGDYSYRASVKNNNQLLVKSGSFAVREIVSEKINTVANHRMLYQLSAKTKGKFFYPDNLNELEKELLANETIKPITYSQNTTNPIIELRWLFIPLILLLASEWYLRKRHLHI